MREFGDDEEIERPVAARPPGHEVGSLEPIDDVLGEEGPRERDPRRRGGGRRPRH